MVMLSYMGRKISARYVVLYGHIKCESGGVGHLMDPQVRMDSFWLQLDFTYP